MFKVALDILPVKASAISCECIFSSSKEACTMRRSLLSLCTARNYSIKNATEAAINELLLSGETDELLDLLHSMDDPDSST